VPKWVPTAEQVVALIEVVPEQFRAAIWLGAGEALRISAALGVEQSSRCIDAGVRSSTSCSSCGTAASMAGST
jgi:hypothetical protein